ncbi:MAG: hypothetical protein ABI912_04585 [Actinomycetota bacterium]
MTALVRTLHPQAELLSRVAARAAVDPESVLPVLRVLVGDDEPAEDVDEKVLQAAELVNSRRLEKARRTFMSSALTTEQVGALLGGASRQAVSARRGRGGLLAITVGTTAYHPDWQFGPEGVVTGLGRVLDALRAIRAGPLSADALMRAPQADLGGRSLADLLRDGVGDGGSGVDTVTARILDTGGGL